MGAGRAAPPLARQARADEAVDAWSHALARAQGVSSDRLRNALASARLTLVGFQRRGVPAAADLDQRIARAIATRVN